MIPIYDTICVIQCFSLLFTSGAVLLACSQRLCQAFGEDLTDPLHRTCGSAHFASATADPFAFCVLGS